MQQSWLISNLGSKPLVFLLVALYCWNLDEFQRRRNKLIPFRSKKLPLNQAYRKLAQIQIGRGIKRLSNSSMEKAVAISASKLLSCILQNCLSVKPLWKNGFIHSPAMTTQPFDQMLEDKSVRDEVVHNNETVLTTNLRTGAACVLSANM